MSDFNSWFRRNRVAVIVTLILLTQAVVWSPALIADFKNVKNALDIAWHVAFNLRNALVFVLAGVIIVAVIKAIERKNLQ